MARPIRVRSSSEVFTQPLGGPSVAAQMDGGAAYRGLADLAGTVHDIAEDVAVQRADAAGSAAVTRDPESGDLTLEKLPMGITAWDKAYRHSALAAYQAESDTDRVTHLQKLSVENADDPEKFEAAANAFVNSQSGAAPAEVKGGLIRAGRQDVAQLTAGLTTKKQARDLQASKESLTFRLKSLEDDFVALHAVPGGADTAEARQVGEEINLIWDNLTDNPLFGVSPAERDRNMRLLAGKARGEAILGYFKRGGGTTGLATVEAALGDPGLGITPGERQSLIIRANAIQNDQETTRRQAEAQAARDFGIGSDERLKDFMTKTPTLEQVHAAKNFMSATDYRMAIELAKGPGSGTPKDNITVVSELEVTYDQVPTDEFRRKVYLGMRNGSITRDTGSSLISKNAAAFKDDAPVSPYLEGRNFVRNSLAPGEFTRDYGGRQAQSKALREWDSWIKDHPSPTPEEAQEMSSAIVKRYELIEDTELPLSFGRPYGFSGGSSAATVDDVNRADAKLAEDALAGRLSDAQIQAENNRIKAWREYLAKKAATKPRAP